MPSKYGPAKAMYKTSPLTIDETVKDKEASNYKAGCLADILGFDGAIVFCMRFPVLVQAAWDQEACSKSIKVNGVYEASGLALWLRTGIMSTGKGRDVDPGDVTFAELDKFKTEFFSKSVTLKASVMREKAKKARVKDRLLWPVDMVCGCESPNELKHDCFDQSLNLASCHFVLWAWYLAVFEALRASESW